MSQRKCPCETLERLEGASVPAYIIAYLDQPTKEKNLYRCRVCGREWEKRLPASMKDGRRPSLVRLN
jgi:hypothetical protein